MGQSKINADQHINNSTEDIRWAQKGGIAGDSHFVTMVHKMFAQGVIQA